MLDLHELISKFAGLFQSQRATFAWVLSSGGWWGVDKYVQVLGGARKLFDQWV